MHVAATEVSPARSVCLTAQSSSLQRFTHKNYMKTKIVVGAICTVLEDIIETY